MQTPYQIGSGHAAEALDQADGLMAREPDYYRTLGDVLESYATNMGQTCGITDANVTEANRGFLDVLRSKGVDYRPHSM